MSSLYLIRYPFYVTFHKQDANPYILWTLLSNSIFQYSPVPLLEIEYRSQLYTKNNTCFYPISCSH